MSTSRFALFVDLENCGAKAATLHNILDRRFSGLITDAFEIRNESDYDDFFIVVKADVEQEIEETKELLEAIKQYLINRGVVFN